MQGNFTSTFLFKASMLSILNSGNKCKTFFKEDFIFPLFFEDLGFACISVRYILGKLAPISNSSSFYSSKIFFCLFYVLNYRNILAVGSIVNTRSLSHFASYRLLIGISGNLLDIIWRHSSFVHLQKVGHLLIFVEIGTKIKY